MKRLFFTGLLAVVFSALCYADGARLYKFDDLKFSIESPAGYEPQKSEKTVSIILSHAPADKQNFKPIITLSSTQNTNPPIDLDGFFNLVLQNFLKDANFSIILAERTKLGDKDVYQLLYKRKAALKDSHDNVVSTKVLQIYIAGPSRVYVMNYSAAESDYDSFLAVANEIFKSFKII